MDGLKGRQERSDPVTVPTWIQPQRDAFPKVTLLCRGEERKAGTEQGKAGTNGGGRRPDLGW